MMLRTHGPLKEFVMLLRRRLASNCKLALVFQRMRWGSGGLCHRFAVPPDSPQAPWVSTHGYCCASATRFRRRELSSC